MTALVTTQVRATYLYPDGTPVVGATVVADLSKYETDNGLVVPSRLTVWTDANGVANLNLWPNTRGVNGSTYTVYIVKDNKTVWSGKIVVPELDTIVDVHTILQSSPVPALDAAQVAVLQAQEYAAQAAASAELAVASGGGGTVISSETAESIKTKLGIAVLSGDNTGDETTASIKTKLGVTTLSGDNTGDESAASIKTKLGITTLSGANTGDETTASIQSKLGVTTISGSNTGDETATTIKSKLGVTTLAGDNTGDESLESIRSKLGITVLSGDNTGDETAATIKTKLGVTTLSGSNTGDETSATIKSKLGVTVLSGSNTGDQTLTSLGIPNVENKSSADIRGELTSGNVTTALGYTPPTQSALDAKMANPLTTAGDMIIGGTGGVPTRLPVGSNGQVYTVVSGLPAWVAASSNAGSDFLSTLLNAEVGVTGTATLTIGKMHVCLGTTTDYTVTLPSVTGNAGKFVGVRMSNGLTKLVTVKGAGAEVIDGSNTRIMWANEVAILYCDGITWTKVGGKSIAMSAKAYLSSNQSISTATAVKILVNTASTGLNSAGVFVPATNNFVLRRPSTWNLAGGLQLITGQTSAAAIVMIYKDNGSVNSPYLSFAHMSSATNLVITGVTQLTGVAGSTFNLYGYSNTSSPVIGGSENVTFISGTEVLDW